MAALFTPLRDNTVNQIGGKASSLASLSRRGYPVPEGLVIPISGFSGEQLNSGEWTQVHAWLAAVRQKQPGVTFTVRSSAVSEDSIQASFAGEFESLLDLETDADIRAAIEQVRRSAHSERVKAYSQSHGLSEVHETAVIVQRFIRAELAGVLFTADPVSGDLMHMTGNFVRGGNEKLVSGETNAQSFTFDRANGRYNGAPELRPYARQLYRFAEKLDRESDAPQDIEWVIAGGQVYLVQARPITSLRGFNPVTGEWNDSLRGDFLWTNGNGAEIQPQVMPLLTATINALWGQGYGEWWSPRYPASGVIGGRTYFNITAQIAPFAKIPGMNRDRLIAYVGQWWGQVPKAITLPFMPFSLWKVITFVVPMYVRAFPRMSRQRAQIPEFVEKTPRWCKDMRQRIQQIPDSAALRALWLDELKPYYLFGTAMASVSNLDIRARLEAKLRKWVSEEDANTLVSNLSGDDFLASLGPVLHLQKVARGDMTRESYLEQYGHRSPNEFNLIYPQPIENPAWLDDQLRDLERYPADVEALLTKQRAKFADAWQRFADRYPGKVKIVRRQLDQAAQFAHQREAARSELTRIMGVLRAWVLKVAEVSGIGDEVFHLTIDEVASLLAGDSSARRYVPARRQTYDRYCSLPPYPPVISGRFDPFAWAAAPNRRLDAFDSHTEAFAEAADGRDMQVLIGFGGSAGIVEGRVRCVDTPENVHLLEPGEILVTSTTNVGWTPLFPRAGGIVTDVGAPLSHAAIVARELGIPAVVGCNNATSRLKTGDRVRVNGLRGTVEILAQGS
ncbi:MAG: PEP/pyruvate-binding domain-containing protein [Anaerolineae bacterium]